MREWEEGEREGERRRRRRGRSCALIVVELDQLGLHGGFPGLETGRSDHHGYVVLADTPQSTLGV